MKYKNENETQQLVQMTVQIIEQKHQEKRSTMMLHKITVVPLYNIIDYFPINAFIH